MNKLHRLGLAAAALVLITTICYRALETPFWSVNGARLMPSFMLARGLDYYVLQPPGGPLYSTLYGPLVAIVYLPATWFGSPNAAVLAGTAITVLLCFLAAAFLHLWRSRGAVDWLAFLAAAFLMCYLTPLKYSCFNIHADGPGLAFGALACGLLYTSGPISAVCAALAIFCKQMFLPVPVALLVSLYLAEGWPAVRRYVGWLAVFGVAASALALWWAGPERLYHCLIWIPGHHPFYEGSRWRSAIQAAREFIRVAMPVPVLLLAAAIYAARREMSWRTLAASRCVPLLLVGVALLPFSIAGRAKVGGDINSLSFALFFLTCGLTVMLADVARAETPRIGRMAVTALVAIVSTLAISEAPLAPQIPAKIRQLPQAEQQVAFAYLQRHPGGAYFPWFPISHYYAEGKFVHWSFGVVDRLMAGEPVSTAAFRAYMPPDPRLIAFGADGTSEVFGYDLMRYLPEYGDRGAEPELPGWVVYTKGPGR